MYDINNIPVRVIGTIGKLNLVKYRDLLKWNKSVVSTSPSCVGREVGMVVLCDEVRKSILKVDGTIPGGKIFKRDTFF